MIESNVSSETQETSELGKKLLPLIKGLLFGGAILTLGIFIMWIVEKDPGSRSVLLGLGIMLLGLYVWFAILAICQVPTPQEWPVELFGEYHRTLYPGLNFIIPGVEKVRSKITVGATRTIRIFMRGKEDKLDFTDDSAEVTVEIRAKVLGSYKPTYHIIFTGDEIRAIEEEEKQKGNVRLPENWMYLLMMRVEAALRGICGGMNLDDVIKSVARRVKTEAGEKVELELEFDKDVSRMVEIVVDAALKERYDIDVEEVMIKNVKLSEPTEKGRRAIQLAKKKVEVETVNVLKEEQIVRQTIQKALQDEQKGAGIQKMLDAIVADNPDLSRADAMDYLIRMKVAETVEDVNILSTGKEDDIPTDLGVRFGATFGLGSELGKKKRRDEE